MKKPKLIFYLSLLLSTFLVPFILQKSFFPFYRYGMFAEPPTKKLFEEKFAVLVLNNNIGSFDPLSKGMYPSVFSYLLRNHYYRNESLKFLEVIAKNDTTNEKYYLVRYYYEASLKNQLWQTDTVAIFSLK